MTNRLQIYSCKANTMHTLTPTLTRFLFLTHTSSYTHISIHHCCFCTWFLLLTGEERGSRERRVKEWSRNMCCGALGRTNPAMPVCLKMHWQTDKQTEGKQKQRSKLSTDTKRLFNERVFNYIVFGIDSNISISFHNTQ